jgi:uncharacterized protein with FMN-binding domain
LTKKWKILILLFSVLAVSAAFILYFSVGLGDVKALDIGSVSTEGKEDGYYKGSYEYGRWSSAVEVVVRDEKIVDVNIIEPVKDSEGDVGQTISERVLESQGTDIDAVTGATVDSNIYLKAIEKAMDN